MLPAFLTSPRMNVSRKVAALGATAAVITAMAAPPAMAWGDKEQNFLAGVATTVAIAAILDPSLFYKKSAPTAHYQTQIPVYYSPAPTYTSSIYQTPSATAFNSYETGQRKRIQSKLAAQGYYHSTIDGDFGPNTYNAVVAYANSTGKSNILSTSAGAFTIYDGLLY